MLSIFRVNINETEVELVFREESIGDKGVIQQIFTNNDYALRYWPQGKKLLEYHNRQSNLRPSLIIDAGANIGASTLYFLCHYTNSVVFSIEPDKMNWNLLETNTQAFDNAFNFHGAISDTDAELALIDPGKSDWGFTTAPVESVDSESVNIVKSISPTTILSHEATQNTNPLIFKIDIEGGEDRLFRGDVSWMKKFPLIIIELHDWLHPFSGSSRNFLKAIAQFEFDFVHRGENIFLFNREILG